METGWIKHRCLEKKDGKGMVDGTKNLPVDMVNVPEIDRNSLTVPGLKLLYCRSWLVHQLKMPFLYIF